MSVDSRWHVTGSFQLFIMTLDFRLKRLSLMRLDTEAKRSRL